MFVNLSPTSAVGLGSVNNVKNTSNSNSFDYFNMLSQISANNTATSQAIAREQMGFQASQSLQTQKFNQQEAEKTRQWQEYMSNTAHQREVQDLIKAGLNPVLSASLNGSSTPTGSTASASGVPSGASGQVDTSLVSSLVNLATAFMNSSTSLENAKISAQASKYDSDISRLNNKDTNAVNLVSSILGSVFSGVTKTM